MPPGRLLTLDNGATASLWAEALRLEGAEAKASFTEGHLAGTPAVTRNRHGSGDAWYIGTVLDPQALRDVVAGREHRFGLLSAARGVQLAELGLRSNDERRTIDIPEITL